MNRKNKLLARYIYMNWLSLRNNPFEFKTSSQLLIHLEPIYRTFLNVIKKQLKDIDV